MKTKSLMIIFLILFSFQVDAQIGKAFNKLKEKVASEILGDEKEDQKQLLTQCACEDAETVLKFSGNLKLDYRETDVCIDTDGKVLLLNKITYEYYISGNGITKGPFTEDDPQVKKFHCFGGTDLESYPEYISEKNGKWLITFNGKEYGPYAIINDFYVTLSGKKFVAIVIKDNIAAGIDMEDLEKKMSNATQEEQIAYAMEMSKKMQEQYSSGGEMDMTPKLVSNIKGVENISLNIASISSSTKYDDFCIVDYNQVTDLTGNTLINLRNDIYVYGDNFWIKSDNSRYAWFDYGTLSFSDGKRCDNVFSPSITMEGNIEYIRYMFYSPEEDAIKFCKIPF